MTLCERTCIDFIPTGLTAPLRQIIAELGMSANKSLSTIDWTTILYEYVDIDSQLDEWEDVTEGD